MNLWQWNSLLSHTIVMSVKSADAKAYNKSKNMYKVDTFVRYLTFSIKKRLSETLWYCVMHLQRCRWLFLVAHVDMLFFYMHQTYIFQIAFPVLDTAPQFSYRIEVRRNKNEGIFVCCKNKTFAELSKFFFLTMYCRYLCQITAERGCGNQELVVPTTGSLLQIKTQYYVKKKIAK